MSDPDFTHLVETNRLGKNVSNSSSQKTQAQTKTAYMHENIKLRFEDDSLSTNNHARSGILFEVPRFRLDKEFIQSAVNRITAKNALSKPKVSISHLISAKAATKDTAKLSSRPPGLLFSHLLHQDSNTIIMSDTDLKTKCSANVTYNVIARPAITIKEGGVLSRGNRSGSRSLSVKPPVTTNHIESHYDGNVLFIVHDVPLTSQNGTHEVTENDVSRWILSGAIRNTETVDVLTKKIESLKQTLLQIEQEMTSLPPPAPARGGGKGKGRGTVGSSQQSVRDRKAKFLSDAIHRNVNLLQTATQSLETLYSQHTKDCSLYVEKRSSENLSNDNACDWAIQVLGEKEGMYTSLIEKNKNWSMITMYAFGAKGNKAPMFLTIQSEHFVDIGGITMSKLPHGFGIFESYEEYPLKKSSHRLYHGQFHEGEMSEGTLYADAGVYSGKFERGGQPILGTLEYADGIKISGEFAGGLPDGQVQIIFPDKATYEGNMSQGRITGRGDYKYAGLEFSGQYQDGVLHVNEGDEGQGYSNLHFEFCLGGERLVQGQ